MALTVLIGGARAGKSALAAKLATKTALPVTYVATAEALDDEMKDRIARHRADRPENWATVEEPVELEGALAGVGPGRAIVVDCLTMWVSNLMLNSLSDDKVEGRAAYAASLAAQRDTPTFVVTNEVGSGVHPSTELGRRFRDVLGRVNVIWAAAAAETLLVVAGRVITLTSVENE
jgi:adenosyl cobinamide kinase/adenosyl cobinamide phosphate guanylyltransferase